MSSPQPSFAANYEISVNIVLFLKSSTQRSIAWEHSDMNMTGCSSRNTVANSLRWLDHKQFAQVETPFMLIPDESAIIAETTQEIEMFSRHVLFATIWNDFT